MKLLINAFHGFCMALADSVPGVSGGTIAFILGFYDKFINALDTLMYGKIEEKKEAVIYLLKLGLGWLIGMGLAIIVLTSLFENHIYKVSSVFLGFIIFAIPFIIKEEKNCLKGKYYNVFFLLLGVVIVSLITYFNPMASTENAINITNLNLGGYIYLFVAAMIAISAMVLPGISGSTLLLIFGLYIPITTAIKNLLYFHFEALPALIVFGLGVIAGIFIIIRFIKIALQKYRSATIYSILGLMIGSLYAIVMGPTTLESYHAPLDLSTFSLISFLIGGFIIIGLEELKKVLEKKEKSMTKKGSN